MSEDSLQGMKIYRHWALFSLSMAALLVATSCFKSEDNVPSVSEFATESVVEDILARTAEETPLPSILDPNLMATQPWKIAYISKEPRVDSPKSMQSTKSLKRAMPMVLLWGQPIHFALRQ